VYGPVMTLGAGDCERLHDGLVAQPANTASALAYLLAGAWLARRSWRHGAERPAEALAFGLAVAAAGVGSVDFHGTGSPAARWLHDAGLQAALSFVAVHDLAALAGARSREVPAWAGLAGAGGVLLVLAPGAGGALTAGLGLLAAGAEVAAGRRGLRAGWSPRRRAAYRAGLAALAAGSAAWLLGRTGGPLCDPDSLLQAHAAWHLLSAFALAAWGRASLDGGTGRPAQARS
jgi:hypothetical protein